jgi:uncharacterized repeat protein (TIGR03803 family)
MRAAFQAGAAILVAGAAQAAPVKIIPPIFSFTNPLQGAEPMGGLTVDAAGNIYGTTLIGGATCSFNGSAGCGAVYQLSPPGQQGGAWTQSVLHSFVHYAGGAEPAGAVIRDDAGNLYGTTVYGGQYGLGVAYELSPPGAGQTAWTQTVLHNFAGAGDGASPQAGLVLASNGTLYGTAYYQNGGGGCGSVFSLTPPAPGKTAWTEATLYNFAGPADGCQPQSALIIGAGGVLYGTTTSGGAGKAGTLFSLTPPANGSNSWTEATVYSFPAASGGAGSWAGLLQDAAGALYVATAHGGGGACSGGCGVMNKLTQSGGAWSATVIYSFLGGKDGRHPGGQIAFDAQGNLYGATRGHLATPGGTVFRLTPAGAGAPWTETTLYHFLNAGDGAEPNSGAVLGQNGEAYGTLQLGGAFGAVFGISK